MDNSRCIHIIGGGLAGVEAAWHIANNQIPVKIYEMRPQINTEAHTTDLLAELVCSNSFRSDDSEKNAVGLLHNEMRLLNSITMLSGDKNRVPAGSAMAVDRVEFSKYIQQKIQSHPLIEIFRKEITEIPIEFWKNVIIATGPLTSTKLAAFIKKITGFEHLAFIDAIAPIIYYDSINMKKAWHQSRYDKSFDQGNGKDYINCPLSKDLYYKFVKKITDSDISEYKEWEKNTPYFESCLPIEEMAKRGEETLRWGPMKPVGLTNPHKTKEQPWAVVQLRQDNKLATLFNMVGFQTKIKHNSQVEIFRTIPGLENAKFARLGGIHRNTFINSPKLLDIQLRLKTEPKIRFAGQITGVEGYVESAAIGLIAGYFASSEIQCKKPTIPPETSAFGSLLRHITVSAYKESFQPMNINFGLFPKLENKTKKDSRKQAYTIRAKKDFASWTQQI